MILQPKIIYTNACCYYVSFEFVLGLLPCFVNVFNVYVDLCLHNSFINHSIPPLPALLIRTHLWCSQ